MNTRAIALLLWLIGGFGHDTSWFHRKTIDRQARRAGLSEEARAELTAKRHARNLRRFGNYRRCLHNNPCLLGSLDSNNWMVKYVS